MRWLVLCIVESFCEQNSIENSDSVDDNWTAEWVIIASKVNIVRLDAYGHQ